jgi:4-hydroxy-2-oxoheptanedioate aldolase
MTTLREIWDRDGMTLGGWCTIPNSFSAEIMAHAGFDWICIDTQHGLIDYHNMIPMLQAIAAAGRPAFVRVAWNQPDYIMKALDAGAQGVIVPMVNSKEDALRAVQACRYPPLGERSWGPRRASLGVPGYTPEEGNRRTVLAIMIETRAGIENLDAILQVPGVDAVYLGPSDLALTHLMRPTGSPTEPAHIALIERVLDACLRHGVVPGMHQDSIESARHWAERGFRMINVTSDSAFLSQAASSVVQAMRAVATASPTKA